MNIVMIYDQIQSGLGTKDDTQLPLGLLKEPVGPAIMMEPHLKGVDGHVVATLYCGWQTYLDNPQEVVRKLALMCEKIKPDVVICGPAFDYAVFGRMCAHVAAALRERQTIPACAALNEELTDIIDEYRDKATLVKMPQKGGTGLALALQHICEVAETLALHQSLDHTKRDMCF